MVCPSACTWDANAFEAKETSRQQDQFWHGARGLDAAAGTFCSSIQLYAAIWPVSPLWVSPLAAICAVSK